MRNYLPILVLLSLFIFSSCEDSERRKTLDRREALLEEKEREFGAKEADYQSLLKMRDSLQKISLEPDAPIWPASVNGAWTSKIVCVESNCPDYVIGDTRSDTWEFARDSSKMFVNIRDRDKLVRTYSAQFLNEQIQLAFSSDSSAAKRVEMKVLLNEITGDRLRGMRTVSIGDQCQAKFNVTLTRPAASL